MPASPLTTMCFALSALAPAVADVVEIAGFVTGDRVRLVDGRTFGLHGLHGSTDQNLADVPEFARGPWNAVEIPEWRGALRHRASTWWLHRGYESLNARLVRQGLARPRLTAPPATTRLLVPLAIEARRGGLGSWSGTREPGLGVLDGPRPVRAVVLPLHSTDPEYAYQRELAEIAALGATWVELSLSTTQPEVDSSHLRPLGQGGCGSARLTATIEHARSLGLEVLILPYVLIEEPDPGDWRGVIRPAHPEEWWRHYTRYLSAVADAATAGGATALCVGSELCSLEHERSRWRRLITGLRARFPGLLCYSANWDHYREPTFWDQLDFAGITGYFELSSTPDPDRESLMRGWARAREEVLCALEACGLPLIFTELGIPSIAGGAHHPWNHTAEGAVDHGVQLRAFEAFETLFASRDDPWLAELRGYALYDWWGWGGPGCAAYTARDKPAVEVWKRLLAPSASGQ